MLQVFRQLVDLYSCGVISKCLEKTLEDVHDDRPELLDVIFLCIEEQEQNLSALWSAIWKYISVNSTDGLKEKLSDKRWVEAAGE